MTKETIKKIIPKRILDSIQRFRTKRIIKSSFMYDFNRYINYSFQYTTEEADIAHLALLCHGIEKGFSMPDFRVGFGEKRIDELLNKSRIFMNKYGKQNEQFLQIVKVLYEYRLCHNLLNATVPESIKDKLNVFLSEFPEIQSDHVQLDETGIHYFDNVEKPFPLFAASRHSVRNFSDKPVAMEKIYKAIDIAKGAPSACNRQSSRVVIVKDKKLISKVLSQHGGNRGFGHTIDKVLLIGSYLPGYHGSYERNWCYVDAGIFTMNLAYALHYEHIGAVILNWSMEPDRNKIIYDALQIPDYLTIVVMIAIGNVPESFKVCESGKKSLSSLILER